MIIVKVLFGAICLLVYITVVLYALYTYIKIPVRKPDTLSRVEKKKYKSLNYLVILFLSSLIVQIVFLFFGIRLLGISNAEIMPYAPLITVLTLCQQFFWLIKVILMTFDMVRRESKIINLIKPLVMSIFFFNMVFGALYNFLSPIHLPLIKLFYFAFAINFSLPLVDDSFVKFQNIINNNSLLMVVQVSHIIIQRLVDLLVLGQIVSKILKIEVVDTEITSDK